MVLYLTEPSNYMMEILEEIKSEFEGRIEIVQVKIDDVTLSPLCKQQGIHLPTVIVFKQGKIISLIPEIDDDGITMLLSLAISYCD